MWWSGVHEVRVDKLFDVGAHFGHLIRFSNRKMLPYIYGSVAGMGILDLHKTVSCFNLAVSFLREKVVNGGVVLFVGTKRSARTAIEKAANECSMPYVNNRWPGGLLTNFNIVRRSVGCLHELKKVSNSININSLVREERIILTRRLKRLTLNYSGILNMYELPDVLFVIDVKNERAAVVEANLLGIPVIGIVDTDSDPDGVDFVIPGNDDSLNAVNYYVDFFSSLLMSLKKHG